MKEPPETARKEQSKYETMWEQDSYRRFSPGLWALQHVGVIDVFRQLEVHTILDAGCGSGKAMQHILETCGGEFEVHGFDIAANCLDSYFDAMRAEILSVGNLWDRGAFVDRYDAVYCTDVMEHVPTDRVADVLANLRQVSKKVSFFGIALFDDKYGPAVLGEPLHLTVKPPEWWMERLQEAGYGIVKSLAGSDKNKVPVWLYVFVDPLHPGERRVKVE